VGEHKKVPFQLTAFSAQTSSQCTAADSIRAGKADEIYLPTLKKMAATGE
jgi:hypothetical protein